MPDETREPTPSLGEEPPPIGGTWRRLYTAVVVYAFATIVLLYALTVALNR